jgi:NAD(P)-dependent dehydrogenase (short-subunit alcohol dehydrogenase family)
MIARSIAFELRDDQILSIVVHPGWVRTAMGGPNASTSPAEAPRRSSPRTTPPRSPRPGSSWTRRALAAPGELGGHGRA